MAIRFIPRNHTHVAASREVSLDRILHILYNVYPRSSDPYYIVKYYIKWVTTSWTDRALKKKNNDKIKKKKTLKEGSCFFC